MTLMLLARPKCHRSVRVQTTLTLPHMTTLEVRLQTLHHPSLRSLVATLRALRPVGSVPLWSTFLHIRQFAELRLQRFFRSLTFPLIHDHLVSNAENKSRLRQVETVPCARTPRPSEPIAHHALVLAGALSTGVRCKSLITPICVWRRSIAEDGAVLNACSAFRAALGHPLGSQPRALLVLFKTTLVVNNSSVGSIVTLVDPRIANNRKGTIWSG